MQKNPSMKRYILFLYLFSLSLLAKAGADFQSPDFAYPATVSTDAREHLSSKDPSERFLAMMQIVRAQSSVSTDSLYVMSAFVESMIARESDPCWKGLMTLYKASVIRQIYQMRRFISNDVEVQADQLPSDPALWTGRQMQNEIGNLLQDATTMLEPFGKKPIVEFRKIIEIPAQMQDFFPFLRDFVYEICATTDVGDSRRWISEALDKSVEGSPEWAQWAVRRWPYETDKLLDLYYRYPAGLCGGLLLWRATGDVSAYSEGKEIKRAVSEIRKYLSEKNPDFFRAPLEGRLKRICVPRVSIEAPSMVAPGSQVEIKLEYSFTSLAGVELQRQLCSGKYETVAKYTVNVSADSICASALIKFKAPGAGNYYIKVISDKSGKTEGYSDRATLTVTPWIPLGGQDNVDAVVVVADFNSGAPVADVCVDLRNSDKGKTIKEAVTREDGIVRFSKPNGRKASSEVISLKKTNVGTIVFPSQRFYPGSVATDSERLRGMLLTSRPVYHQGDTLEWALLAGMAYSDRPSQLCTAKSFVIELYDANNELVDTAVVTTDRFGRCNGEFNIPSDRLTGIYRLNATPNRGQDKNQFVVTCDFMVSDFKLVEFRTDSLDAERQGDSIIVSGLFKRSTGEGVADGNVNLTAVYADYYQYRSPEDKQFRTEISGNVQTSASGRFSWTFPIDSLCPGEYRVKIDAVAPGGESVNASMMVRVGAPVVLRCGAISPVDIDRGIYFPIKAVSVSGRLIKQKVEWDLTGESNKYSGYATIDTDGMYIKSEMIEPGEYTLRAWVADSIQPDSIPAVPVVFYSVDRNILPKGNPLIAVKSTVVGEAGTSSVVKVGIDTPGSVYVFSHDKEGKLQCRVKDLPAGFSDIEIEIPADSYEYTPEAIIARVVNGTTTVQTINIIVEEKEKVSLKGESFRDRLVPGGREHWKLTLSSADGREAGAAIATMFNESLNALRRQSWPENFSNLFSPIRKYNGKSVSSPAMFIRRLCSVAQPDRNITGFDMASPHFMYSNQAIQNRLYGARSPMLLEESVSAAYGSSMKMNSVLATGAYDSEEVAETEEDDGAMSGYDAGEEDSETPGRAVTDQNEYRKAETLQALWKPSLTADSEGNIYVDFDMPDAVGSWQFMAVGWSGTKLSGLMKKSLVSVRPLMVKPSVPRFLRRGDRSIVAATVVNTTLDTVRIELTSEVFNPNDGTVISRYCNNLQLNPGQQQTVDTPFEVADSMSMAGYRVKVAGEGFTDGEQTVVPILDAVTTAIDSDIFFLDQENPEYSQVIPTDTNGDGMVVLNYCQNPLWEVVKALPGFYDPVASTVSSAANSIFASAVASDLNRRFPSISKALDIWLAENGGNALIDPLEKNEELKLLTLRETPFAGAADAADEQMKRLALTFNKETINSVMTKSINVLGRLQRSDGGFAWGTWCKESSVWLTLEALETLGRLHSLGVSCSSPALNEIISHGFEYLDSRTKQVDPMKYTLVYSLFPERKPSTLSGIKILEDSRRKIISGWKKHDVTTKCLDAIILKGLGNNNVANEIMRSVDEFSVKIKGEGIKIPGVNTFHGYAQVLEAYGRISPSAANVEGLIQWLAFNSRNVSGMGTYSPSVLISAMLMTAHSLPDAEVSYNVNIDGKPLEVSDVEKYTGAFTVQLGTKDYERTLSVELPEGCRYSYGDLMTIASTPLDSVKPFSSEHISIGKRFLVNRDGKWLATDSFTRGERVKVQLIVSTDRPLEYVTVTDQRPAAFEPTEQLPGYVYENAVSAYRENRDSETRLFIQWLPKGSYFLSYDVTAAYAGRYCSGVAVVQSQRAPEYTARSGAGSVEVGN